MPLVFALPFCPRLPCALPPLHGATATINSILISTIGLVVACVTIIAVTTTTTTYDCQDVVVVIVGIILVIVKLDPLPLSPRPCLKDLNVSLWPYASGIVGPTSCTTSATPWSQLR
jgi:hypothetical protein